MNQEPDVFRQFMTDTLCLNKPDGRAFPNIRACVSGKNSILIEDIRLPIEVGDKLTRLLPSGLTEEFVVDDPGYCGKFSSIEAHYQVKVHRAGTERSVPRVTTYNVNGPNARLNIHSHDESTNTVALGDSQVLADLRKVVTESSIGDVERAKLLAGIDAMEQTRATPGFIDRYRDFITLATNHMAIISPFLPALSTLLPS